MTIRAATGGLVFFLILAAAGTSGAGLKGNSMEQSIRKPAVAGQFYTSDPVALRREIEDYIEKADPPEIKGDILALISPHAGYVYSGHVAASGYALLEEGQFETVVVISPCHVEYFRFASIYDGDAYETPLGLVKIDKELAEAGVIARARGRSGLAEEQPDAYKDIDAVVECVVSAGLSRKVARLRPIGVIKG